MSRLEKRKILVVAESIDVEDSSGTKGRVALIQNLKAEGFDVLVYHYSRKDIELEGVPCVAIKENRRSLLFLLSRIERQIRYKLKIDLSAFFEGLFGFSFTLYNDRNSIVKGLSNILDFEPNLILTLSKGGSFRPHHALLRLPKWHNIWLAYIHDPYPMHSYPRPYDWVEPGHQKKRRFFSQVAEKASFAGYPSLLLADWMESYYPKLKGKAVVIPHQISTSKGKVSKLPKFFIKGHFTIVHAGTLLSARNPIPIITAFRKFLEKNPEAMNQSQLLFLGPESIYHNDFAEIQKDVPQFYYSEGYVSFKEVYSIQEQASVNIILEAKGPISPFLPGKFPHCIEAGNPILLLGPYYSESRRLLGEGYEYWSEIDDIDKITALISLLFKQWITNPENLKTERQDILDYCSSGYLKDAIDGIIKAEV